VTTTKLGPYTRFERPRPFAVTFYENDGVTVIDVSGYDAVATWFVKGQSPADTPDTFTCTLTTDGTDGQVTVPWGQASPSPFDVAGTVEMEVWVGDGTVRLASEKFRFVVRAAVATSAPAV
jgi:hypothetical protein